MSGRTSSGYVLTTVIMDYMHQAFQFFEPIIGLAALILIFCDQQILTWIERKIAVPRKAAAKRAGSYGRITRSRYYK